MTSTVKALSSALSEAKKLQLAAVHGQLRDLRNGIDSSAAQAVRDLGEAWSFDDAAHFALSSGHDRLQLFSWRETNHTEHHVCGCDIVCDRVHVQRLGCAHQPHDGHRRDGRHSNVVSRGAVRRPGSVECAAYVVRFVRGVLPVAFDGDGGVTFDEDETTGFIFNVNVA